MIIMKICIRQGFKLHSDMENTFSQRIYVMQNHPKLQQTTGKLLIREIKRINYENQSDAWGSMNKFSTYFRFMDQGRAFRYLFLYIMYNNSNIPFTLCQQA